MPPSISTTSEDNVPVYNSTDRLTRLPRKSEVKPRISTSLIQEIKFILITRIPVETPNEPSQNYFHKKTLPNIYISFLYKLNQSCHVPRHSTTKQTLLVRPSKVAPLYLLALFFVLNSNVFFSHHSSSPSPSSFPATPSSSSSQSKSPASSSARRCTSASPDSSAT